MLNDIQKAKIKKMNIKNLVAKMTDYFIDLANIYDRVDVSANLQAENIVNFKKKAGQLNEFDWVPPVA